MAQSGDDDVDGMLDAKFMNMTGEERVKEFMRRESLLVESGNKDWVASLSPHITLISSSSAKPHPNLVFAFTVQEEHCNKLNNLHGGCVATLFDYLTSLPLYHVNSPGFWWYLGVSRTLNVTYLRPMPAGETFHFECEIVHVGKRLATLKGVAKRPSDGAVMAICEHGKFNNDPSPANL